MVQFLINRNQPLAGLHRFGGEQFAGPASEDAFRIRNSLQDFTAKAREFTVLFSDVGPALVGQPNRHAIFGMYSVEQVAISTPKLFVPKTDHAKTSRPFGVGIGRPNSFAVSSHS